jgi:two-component system response regulator FlrC
MGDAVVRMGVLGQGVGLAIFEDRMSVGNRRKLQGAVRSAETVAPMLGGILVVEDDPDLQWHLARMLTVQGHRVVGTSSGDGALALVSQWPVDLILVDETLPGMSGLEVASLLRTDHPGIPVVLMTSEASEELDIAARVAGVVETLVKPFRSEALHELVQRLFPAAVAEPAE